ncbi:MAG: aldose epimerase family protein [Acidimicrobiales bacterium]
MILTPTVELVGSFVDNVLGDRDVHQLSLRHRCGMQLTLTTFGAGIISVAVPDTERPGSTVTITHGPVDLTSLQTVTGRAVGSTIGRVANRIAGADFELDGTVYRLEANEAPNHLHGGSRGFHQQVWEYELLDDTTVRFTLDSPDGEGGYPGTVHAEATYRLGDRRIDIDYTATTDSPTPINLTNHAYWNLAGGTTLGDHRLRIGFDDVLLVGNDGIPLPGPPVPAIDTRFHCNEQHELASVLAEGGLDHCFVGPIDPEREAIVLEHPASGRRLRITTNQPGVQVYTGQHFVPPQPSIAFEPQGWPDSPNRPDFPSCILRPGETYHHHSVYRFDW